MIKRCNYFFSTTFTAFFFDLENDLSSSRTPFLTCWLILRPLVFALTSPSQGGLSCPPLSTICNCTCTLCGIIKKMLFLPSFQGLAGGLVVPFLSSQVHNPKHFPCQAQTTTHGLNHLGPGTRQQGQLLRPRTHEIIWIRQSAVSPRNLTNPNWALLTQTASPSGSLAPHFW